ncbi:hypothetical protein [Bacillus sp. RO2]|nr:hypothetical protein [Bacillus sp. RO2]
MILLREQKKRLFEQSEQSFFIILIATLKALVYTGIRGQTSDK